MKKIGVLIIGLFSFYHLAAQSDGLSYQAVIINENAQEIPGVDVVGNYLSEAKLEVRFTIYDEYEAVLFQEIQSTETDPYGMINLIIGQGDITGESNFEFDEIDWNGEPKDLMVEISIGESTADFEALSREELLFVPYAYHRNMTATGYLIVDGETTLNDDFEVLNQASSTLTGSLTVDGETYLNNSLVVFNESPTYLTGDLTVDGTATFNGPVELYDLVVLNTTNLEGSLDVNNGSISTLSGPVYMESSMEVDMNATFNAEVMIDGATTITDRLVVNANVNGDQSSTAAYPLEVRGSNQGIMVEIDQIEESDYNFVSFKNGQGNIIGRIEGQTYGEYLAYYRTIFEYAIALLNAGLHGAEAGACGAQFDVGEVWVNGGGAITVAATWGEVHLSEGLNVGVAYNSGGADYAEYIKKANILEDMSPGQIVGVRGGLISKDTEDVDHFMVISSNPVVVGNLQDDMILDEYERVAFIGQVPVKVLGAVEIGDYILPSGNNDGLGIAKSSDEMSFDDYRQIVGIAWTDGKSDLINMANVAIGLNSNDMSSKMEKMQMELESQQKQIDQILALLSGDVLDETAINSIHQSNTPEMKDIHDIARNTMTEEELEIWLSSHKEYFEEVMGTAKTQYEEWEIDYQQYEDIALLIDNPTEALRQMYHGEFMKGMWDKIEKKYGLK